MRASSAPAEPQPAAARDADGEFNSEGSDSEQVRRQGEPQVPAVDAAEIEASQPREAAPANVEPAETEPPAEELPHKHEAELAQDDAGAEGVSASEQRPALSPPPFDGIGPQDSESGPAESPESEFGEDWGDEAGTRTERVGRRTTTPRPRREEDWNEYPAQYFSADLLPADYLAWNRAIARHLLLSSSGQREAYLSVTPRILAAAISEVEGTQFTPDAAEEDFATSVARVYSQHVLPSSGRLRTLRVLAADRLPVCTAFLALSVLAAYRMQTDEDAAGNAYYIRLAELLRCDRVGVYPRGFDPRVFESLWRFTAEWLTRETGIRLAMPREDVGIRRFIALPLSHVPLRLLDIERLPVFFSWADYQPASRLERSRLASDLLRWVATRGGLTQAGISALNDDRREAVLAQVAGELEAWDGSMPESGGRRSANVEVALDVIRSRPEFTYLPRRPAGFPSTFDDGSRIIQAGEEGFYDALPLPPASGDELSQGFSWDARLNGSTLSLRRRGMIAIPLGPSMEYSGFLSTYGLPKGATCAVMCQESHSRMAAEFLSAVSETPCKPIEHPDIPRGWRLFPAVKVRRLLTPPSGLEVLAIKPEVELIFSGGLRLGRRLAWIEGAPPRVLISGIDADEQVTIDSERVKINEDGAAEVSGELAAPGVHVVAVGQTRRIIETVRPGINTSILAGRHADGLSAATIPQGVWTVLGALPGQVASSSGAAQIWRGAFEPVWAVHVSAGPGAAVLPLQNRPTLPIIGPPPQDKARVRRCDLWASVIYDAHVRRPSLHAPPGLDAERAAKAWSAYVEAARTIKRSRRGRRR